MVLSKAKNGAGVAILALADFLSLLLLFYLAGLIRINVLPLIFDDLPSFLPSFKKYFWIFPVWLAVFSAEGLYSKRLSFWDEIKLLIQATAITMIVIFSVLFISKKGPEFSRILVITLGALSVFALPVIRPNVKKLIYAAGLMKRKVLIVGSGENAAKILKALSNEKNLGYEIAGFIDDGGNDKVGDYRVHRGIDKIENYIKSSKINDVIITKENLSGEDLADLINHVQHKAENTLYIPDFSGIAVSGTELKYFFTEQTIAIEIKNNLAQPLIYLSKRVMDYIFCLLISPFLLIPLLLISLAIRFTTKSRALYKQKRFGKGGKTFLCYKFQTMYPDAEARLKHILDSDPALKEEFEKHWKLKNDPRVTPIGVFLRKTSLDELPQILNIFKGEMSLVGPRPLPDESMKLYPPEETPFYYMVPPGITGLWQVSGRSNTSFEYHASLNSWYVKNWNLWLDIVILFKTVSTVLKREGAC